MMESTRLTQLTEEPGAPLLNWQEIIQEIEKEFSAAVTEERRVALLEAFKATMDIAELKIAREDIERFRDARRKHYKLFIVEECLVGENVCTETIYAVTGREVAAGRMAPDDSLREIALAAMAAPHLTRTQLLAQTPSHADGRK